MDGPERKKLKSTYQPSPVTVPAPAPASAAALPSGWTEHTAPTGHKYYYNAETKKSTYTRPTATPAPTIPQNQSSAPAPVINHGYPNTYPTYSSYNNYGDFTGHSGSIGSFPNQQVYANRAESFGQSRSANTQVPQQRPRRPQPQDRPKRKAVIPDCAPWILVYTKLGRRFVHNMETRESFWKFPADVMQKVIAFDQSELERKFMKDDKMEPLVKENKQSPIAPTNEERSQSRRRRSESLQREDEEAMAAELAAANEEAREWVPTAKAVTGGEDNEEGSDVEYEIVEVTESESESEEDEAEAGPANDDNNAVEFGEDDIAYQLAQMGEAYGLDPAEYGSSPDPDDLDGEHEEGAAGLPLTADDREALFHDLLDDYKINPYTPWTTVLDHATVNSTDSILSDDRYTIVTSSKGRSAAYDTWSKTRIAALKASRAATAQLDPRIPYLAFLATHATPKLYWPEFRRKHKSAPEMRATKPPDKDKEKFYREHIARLKLPAAKLKADLMDLLAAQPARILNANTSVDDLPKELLTDLRLISLPEESRNLILRQHFATLPPAPDDDDVDEEAAAARRKAKAEREKREEAMRERERRVEEDKRATDRERRFAEGRLREGERELMEANRVGRAGLRGQFNAGDEIMPASNYGDGLEQSSK